MSYFTTDYDLNDKIDFCTPDDSSSAAWEEQASLLLAACEEMPGPEYGDCHAWDSLIAALPVGRTDLTYREKAERLLDILRLMRAHGPACGHGLASSPEPQCAACMCERKDVMSDRLVLGKPAAVCCGEVA